MNQMEQIERIKEMELRMERAAKAVMELSAALENYEAVIPCNFMPPRWHNKS